MADVTELLVASQAGNKEALDKLLPIVYGELRQIAARQLARDSSNNTLEATDLVHEAYLKLVKQHSVDWSSRIHFFSIAAQTIRRILLNYARDKNRQKRGNNQSLLELNEAIGFGNKQNVDLIKLDEALIQLEKVDSFQSKIIELKFFGGLSNEDVSKVLDTSVSTIKREWRIARAWLLVELTPY